MSIIIPAYNAEDYIERCIISCLNQDYADIEVIVVDDGSQDNTLYICEKYALKFDNLRVIIKSNSGVSETRNLGIEKASGKYVLFVDADDYIEKDMCSQLVQYMNDETDLVICGYYIEENGVQNVRCVKENKKYTKKEFAETLSTMQEEALLYVCWNKLFKREKIKKIFPPNMTFGEDSVFNFGYLEKCHSIQSIVYAGYHYNVQNNFSAMHKYHSDMLEMIVKEFSEIGHCLLTRKMDLLFAQKHLVDNILFFFLPQLFYTTSIDEKMKRNVFKEMSRKPEIIAALQVYKYRGRRQKMVALAIRYNLYFIASLVYKKK